MIAARGRHVARRLRRRRDGGGGGSSAGRRATPSPSRYDSDAAPSGYDPLLYSQGQFHVLQRAVRRPVRHRTERRGRAEPGHRVRQQRREHPDHADPPRRRHLRRRLRRWTPSWSRPTSTAAATPTSRRTARSAPVAASGDHRRHRARREDRRHHLGRAAGDAGRTTSSTRPASSSAPTASPTPTRWRPLRTAPAPYTLNEGETTRASTYTLDKNAEAWNADDVDLRDDRLQRHHRPRRRWPTRSSPARPTSPVMLDPTTDRAGRVAAEHRRASAARSSASP